jgi:hypothetical protein
MRKIILVFLALILIYCMLWFVVASVIENKIKESINSLNSEKIQVDSGYIVKVSGFPFDFSLKLSKPHFRFIESSKNVKAIYDVQFNGDFQLSVGWLVKSIDLVSTGGISIKGTINDYKFNINADAVQNTNYRITLHQTPLYGEGLKRIMALGDNPKEIFSLIKEISIKAAQCNIKTANGNQSLFSADKLQLDIQNYQNQDSIKLSLKQNVVNANFTNAALSLWHNISKTDTVSSIVNTINPNVINYFSVFNLAQLGKMNYFMDLSYDGNLSVSDFRLDVNKLQLQDSIMNVNVKGDVKNDSKVLNLNLTSDSNFSDRWYQLMKQYAQSFKTGSGIQKPVGNRSILGAISDEIKNAFITNNADVYAAYVPRLQTFGQIHNNINLQIKSGNSTGYDVTLKKLAFTVEPYSLELSGDLQQKDQQQAYNMKLTLNGYGIILNDVFGYAQRITTALGHKFFIGGSALDLSQRSRGEIQSFIKQVSDEPTSNSINITISARKDINSRYPAVGQYNSQEFGFLWNRLFADLVIQESADKIKQFLPKELQNELQGHVEKLAPVKDLLSILQ